MLPKLVFPDNKNRGEMMFFIMYRNHGGGHNNIWKPVYKSETRVNERINHQSEFIWAELSILVADLCTDDLDREVKIEFFKSAKNGKHVN